MNAGKEDNKYALIAGICFGVLTVYRIINNMVSANNSEYYSITIWTVIGWIAVGLLTVALFLKNKPIAIGGAGVYALLDAYYSVLYFSIGNLASLMASIALILILILTIKENATASKLWFVAGAILLVGNVVSWISYNYFAYLGQAWRYILFALVEVAGFIMVGLWCKGSVMALSNRNTPVNEYATFTPQSINSSTINSVGGADKLKMYKELLDSGTISQEEFDAKKKQILGL